MKNVDINDSQRRGVVAVFMAVFVLLFAAVITYGQYSTKKTGWEQEINISGIAFYLNDNIEGTEVTSDELGLLAKGDEKALTFMVEERGMASGEFAVEYTINMSLDDNDGLAKAIEVYDFTGNEYKYVCMLDEFVNTPIVGTLGIEDEYTHVYKLVYSEGAGESYEGKSFTLTAEASSEVQSNSDFYYIYFFEDLLNCERNPELVEGKTLILGDNIEMDESITITNKIGLDLNGHTLDLNGNNLNITYTIAPDSEKYPDLSITDRKPGESTHILNNGATEEACINITATNDVMLINDIFEDNSRINVNGIPLDVLKERVQSQLNKCCESIYYSGDTIDFLKGLRYYFDLDGGNHQDGKVLVEPVDENSFPISLSSEEYTVNAGYTFTATHNLDFTLEFTLDNVQTSSELIEADIIVFGSDSITDNMLALVPETIQASLFLPVYDAKTKSHITWVSEKPDLLTSDGVYLPNGYDNLYEWTNQPMKIGVIVETNGKQYYDEKTVTVMILNAQQRTDLLYNYGQMTLVEEEDTISFADDACPYINAALKEDLGLTGISVSIEENDYISSDGYTITLDNKPTVLSAYRANATITFTYNDVGTCTVTREVIAIGNTKAYTYDDIKPYLQPEFTDNANSFNTFWVKGYTEKGERVWYDCKKVNTEEDDPAIEIHNGIYRQDNNGKFTRVGDVFRWIADGESVQAESRYSCGAMIKVLTAYVDTKNVTKEIRARIIDGTDAANDSLFEYVKDNDGKYEKDCYYTEFNTPYDENNISFVKEYNNSIGTLDITYMLTLDVEGVYHNEADEIADYNLYFELLKYFDKNDDGWITCTEAESEMTELRTTCKSLTYNSTNYKCLDLSNKKIESIKGLEYFTNVTGYDLSKNSIVDLQYISELPELAYLKMRNNLVTTLESIQYRDSLTYIDFGNEDTSTNNNNITDLSPIQHLTSVKYLGLFNNGNIGSIEEISGYTKLKELDIRQVDQRMEAKKHLYVLALLKNNNLSIGEKIYAGTYNSNSKTKTNIISGAPAAAKALSMLQVVDETYNTLNLPNEYKYGASTYTIEYFSNNPGVLEFSGTDRKTTSYTINSPVSDTDVSVEISIYKQGDSTDYYFTRNIALNVMQLTGIENRTFIETSTGVYESAATVVPDTILRKELFDKFNGDHNELIITLDDDDNDPDNNVKYYGRQVITQTEINKAEKITLDLYSKGITCLTGLGVFDAGISALNLRGNIIEENEAGVPDISEIAKMTSLTTLYLDGQKYDFSQISAYNNEDPGLTSLTDLYVYGCFELSDDDVLAKLYGVYLVNPHVTIYKDSDTLAWDPYLIPLTRYARSLPSSFTFVEIDDVGDMFKLPSGALRPKVKFKDEDSKYYYVFNFYGIKEIEFDFSNLTAKKAGDLKGTLTSDGTKCIYEGYLNGATDDEGILVGIKYSKYVGYSDTVYSALTLHGTDNTHGAINFTHYVELKLEFNNKIRVRADQDSPWCSLDEMFPGRDLRTAVIATIEKGTTEYIISAQSNGKIDIKTSMTIYGPYSATGKSALQGLQYTTISNLTIQRDANLGTGEYLTNLTSLTIKYSGVDLSKINTNLTNLKTINFGTGGVNSYCIMYDSTIKSEIDGYINTIRDAIIADTTYTDQDNYLEAEEWDALRKIVSSRDSQNKYRFYMNYMPELTSITIENSSVYDWRGLMAYLFVNDVPTGGYDVSKIKKLKIRGRLKNGLLDANSNRNSNSGHAEPIINLIWKKYTDEHTSGGVEYYIGTKASHTADIIYTPQSFHKPTEEHDPKLSTSSAYYHTIDAEKEFNEFSGMIEDLGVKLTIGNNAEDYYYNTNQVLNAGDKIYLPGKTDMFFSMPFSTTPAINYARNYKITWSIQGDSVADTLIDTALVDTDQIIPPISNSKDNYFCLVGTLDGDYYKADGTVEDVSRTNPVYFYYPLLVLGDSAAYNGTTTDEPYDYPDGSYSYQTIKDLSLRFAVFTKLDSANGQIMPGNISGNNALTILDYGAITTDRKRERRFDGVSTLEGLEIFTGITSLKIEDQFIDDVSALSAFPLTNLDLSGNLIYDISAISGKTALTNLDISDNVLKSFDGSTLIGLTNLNLSGNALLTSDALTGLPTTLTALRIHGTSAVGEKETLTKLSEIIPANGMTYQSMPTGEGTQTTKADVDAFLAYLDDSTYSSFTNNISYINIESSIVNISNISFLDTNLFDHETKKFNRNTGLGLVESTAIKVTDNNASPNPELFVYDVMDVNVGLAGAPLTINGVSCTKADFDPAIYTYLAAQSIINGDGQISEISINTELGIKSLKGLDKIGVSTISISISISNNALLNNIGWTEENTHITSLTIKDCALTETAIACINADNCPALATLDLSGVSGIDYSDFSAPTSLTTLKINNEYNYLGVNDAIDDIKRFTNPNTSVFGKTLSEYTQMDFLRTYFKNGVLRKEYYSQTRDTDLHCSYKWLTSASLMSEYTNSYQMASIQAFGKGNDVDERVKGIAEHVSSLKETGGANRIQIPSELYYGDYAEKYVDGLTFYFPKTFTYFGESGTINWQLESTSITGTSIGDFYSFTINKDNAKKTNGTEFLDGDTFTLKGSVSLTDVTQSPVEISHEFTIKRAAINEYTPETTSTKVVEYYLENEHGEVVPANRYFSSSRLLYWLYNQDSDGKNKEGRIWRFDPVPALNTITYNGVEYKKCLPYQQILKPTKMNLPDKGVTSLDGIELFINLKTLSIEGGSMLDISAVNNMQLTSFSYSNAKVTINNVIQDWSPFYNSRSTLTDFTYATAFEAKIEIDDLSFLMGFEELNNVTIGNTDAKKTIGIEHTPGFQYMLAWFIQEDKLNNFKYNGKNYIKDGVLTNDAKGMISEDVRKAAKVLSQLKPLPENKIEIKNNYEMFLTNDGPLTLPAYIDVGGKKHYIEWISMSSFIEIKDGMNGVYPLDFEEADYFKKEHNWTIELVNKDKNLIKQAYLICRIQVDDAYYERVLTINCDTRNEYPGITVPSGYGTYLLPKWGNTEWSAAGSGCTVEPVTIDGTTYQYLVIETGVSSPTMINYGAGNPIPLYFDWSSDNMSQITTFTEYFDDHPLDYFTPALAAEFEAYDTLYSNMTEGQLAYLTSMGKVRDTNDNYHQYYQKAKENVEP